MNNYLSTIFSGLTLLLLGYFIHDIKQDIRDLRQDLRKDIKSLSERIDTLVIGKIIEHGERISKLEPR